MRTIVATKGDKKVTFEQSDTHLSVRGKNVNFNDIQVLMDNDVHNGAEFDGWNVNFD